MCMFRLKTDKVSLYLILFYKLINISLHKCPQFIQPNLYWEACKFFPIF